MLLTLLGEVVPTIRTCPICKGNKIVLKVPSAVARNPTLIPEDFKSKAWCLCTGCKGSGKQWNPSGTWVPYPKAVIRL